LAGSISWQCSHIQLDFVPIAKHCNHVSALNLPLPPSIRCKRSKLIDFSHACLTIKPSSRSTSKRKYTVRFDDYSDRIFDTSLFREAGAIILKIAYGYTVEAHNRDPLVHISNPALDQFSKAGTPGAWLVDMIPACKLCPFPVLGLVNENRKVGADREQ
jgi:hypothetical protein